MCIRDRTSIECNRTLIEAVHLVFGVFDKDEWIAQRKWQEDECIEDSEMAALMWLDSPESNIDANLIGDTISPKDLSSCTSGIDRDWADSLIGLKLLPLKPKSGKIARATASYWEEQGQSPQPGKLDRIDYNAGDCLLYTSPSPRDRQKSRMPSSA